MRALTLARKELRDVLREKSIITAFLVQLFLAGFSALLLAGLTAIHSPEAVDAAPEATVAYDGPGGFRPYLASGANIEVEDMEGDAAMQAFRVGSVDAVVQESYTEDADARRVTIVLADGELEASLLVTRLKGLLLDYEADLRTDRQDRLERSVVVLDTGVRAEGPYAFVHTILVPLLVITPVFLSGAIAGDALSQESRSRTLLLLRSAPLRTLDIIAGKLLVPVLLVPLQVAVWLILFWANGYPSSAPLAVIAFATLLGILLTSAGGLVAALVQDESQTQAAYAVLVLALGVFSLVLPRDPLNTIALLSTGVADVATWQAVGMTVAAAVVSLVAAVWITARRMRTDRL